MEISEERKQYIAGFFDGDGSITIEKQKGISYTLRIKFCQSNLALIKRIQSYYPFLKYDGRLRNNRENNRCEYQLRAAGIQIQPLVNDLCEQAILKYEQLLEAKKMFKYIGTKDTNKQKEEIYVRLKELKQKSTLKPYDRLNEPYIAGLFDAEGSIGIYGKTIRVKITQKSDIIILKQIAERYGNTNSIDNYAISFYGKNALKFLNDIRPFCIYKTPQIDAAIRYIETIDERLTDDILEIRQECASIIKEEKLVDITISDTPFINQETHKHYLRTCFIRFSELSYDNLLLHCKKMEITNLERCPKYEKMIFNTLDWETFKIEPKLEFCETTHQNDLYNYYRKTVSSLPVTGTVGRSIRILIKDTLTDKYIGIMCLSSDVYTLGERDHYIKKTSELDWNNCVIKNDKLKKMLNLSCCVPLQPFGYNTNGGKLIASLAFSKEIFDYYLEKYKEPLLAIVTTSINGKSIMYDRLSQLKLIGFTKGYGSVNIPIDLYNVCKEYNNKWKVVKNTNRIDRFNFLKSLLRHLDLSQDILLHNKKRGIYFGYLFSTKFDQLCDINELTTVKEIYNWWLNRWCKNRIEHLLKTSRIKTDLNLYTVEKFDKNDIFKLPFIIDKKLTDTMIISILKFKTQPYTQQQVAEIINKKYNTTFTINDIAKVYTGHIRPTVEDKEYINLIQTKTKKSKITDEQKSFVIEHQFFTCSEIVEMFKKKFGKEISVTTVSKMIKIPKIQDKVTVCKKKTDSKFHKFDKLTSSQLLTIMKMKSDKKTTQEVSTYIKINYDLYINRNLISRLWNNQIQLPEYIYDTQEYKDMLKNTKKREVKHTKFTQEELDFIINYNESLSKCAQSFKEKYGKPVTRAYISKLKQNKK